MDLGWQMRKVEVVTSASSVDFFPEFVHVARLTTYRIKEGSVSLFFLVYNPLV